MSQQFLIVNPITNNEQSPVSQSNLPAFNQFQIDRTNHFLQPFILNNSDSKSTTSQIKFEPVVTNNQLLTNLGQNQVHDNISSETSQINSPLLVVGINNQISLKDQIHSANSATIAIPHSMNADGNSKLSSINGRESNSPLVEHHELIPVKSETPEITFLNEVDSDNSILSDPGKDEQESGDNEAVLINRNVKVESDGNTFFIKEATTFSRNASVELVEDYASFVQGAIKAEHSDEESMADVIEEREEFIEMKDDNFYDIELKDPLQTEETIILKKEIKDPLQSEVPGIIDINLNDPLQTEQPCITDKDSKDPLGPEEPVKDPLETVDSVFIESDPLQTEEPIIAGSNNSIAEANSNVQFVRVKNTDPPLYRRVICNYVATPAVTGSPQQDESNSQKGSGQGNSNVYYVRVKKTNPPLYRKVICKNDNFLIKPKQIQSLLKLNRPITSSDANAVTNASIPAPRSNGHSLTNLPINSTASNTIATNTIPAPRINGQSRSNLTTNSIAFNAAPATSILAPVINSQRRINLPITSAAINAVPATTILAPAVNSQSRIHLPVTSSAISPVPATSILPPAVNTQSRINLSITSTDRALQLQLKLVNSNNKEVNMTPASSNLANYTSGLEVPGLGDNRLVFVRVPGSNPPTFKRVVGNYIEPTKSPVTTLVNNSQPKSNVPFISNYQAKNPGVTSNFISGVQNINFKSTPTTNSAGTGNTVLRLPEKAKSQEYQYAQYQYIKIRDNPPLYKRTLVFNRDQNIPTKKKE